MSERLNALVGRVLETSGFLASVRALKEAKGPSRLFGTAVRPLTREEIAALVAAGNACADWGRILVADGFTPGRVAGNLFIGDCVLGGPGGGDVAVGASIALPAGIYRSTVAHSEIGAGCLVSNVGLLSNYVIGNGAVLLNAGTVAASRACTFGSGREIAIGIETGGREVLSYAELTIPVAAAVATRRADRELQEAYRALVGGYLEACGAPFGIVERGGLVRNAPLVEDTYVGGGAAVDGATHVQNCALLGSPEERTTVASGAFVRNSCLQWGCEAASMAIVDDAVLTEHSHVERHGKVTQSIIGPNTGVAEGEVTASLVGPFVGFHHQSMLIAALWPEGKGNVAYGANVGSNHTSKAPDQEIWCGEGFFFGLGVNIKFPTDFTGSPYGLVATAVDTLPQKVSFPFCLINKPHAAHGEVPPAYNEIFPGWVLSDNLYAVLRNEGKYKKRNKAKRTRFVFDVFRREIIDGVVDARDRLKNVARVKGLYTEADVPGLGKNFLLEASRVKGIETYGFFIEYYALQGLAARVAALAGAGAVGDVASVYDRATDDPDWEHRRALLRAEGYAARSVADNLRRLIDIHARIAEDTQCSKERDDVRGKTIIPDYAETNTLAPADSFVKETWARAERAKAELGALVAKLAPR